MRKRLRVLGFIAAAVLVLGAASFGAATLVYATQDGDRPTPRELVDEFMSRVASRLSISQDEFSSAVKSTELEMLDEAVADGRISEEMAERLRERIEEGKGFLGLPVGRPHRPGCPHIGLRFIRTGLHLIVEPAADVLGMERAELLAELREGKSLAEVAEEQAVSAEGLKSGTLDGAEAELQEAVSNGRLSEERAERILERLTERIDDIVGGTVPPRFRAPPCPSEA